jgi:hypothetical protein
MWVLSEFVVSYGVAALYTNERCTAWLCHNCHCILKFCHSRCIWHAPRHVQQLETNPRVYHYIASVLYRSCSLPIMLTSWACYTGIFLYLLPSMCFRCQSLILLKSLSSVRKRVTVALILEFDDNGASLSTWVVAQVFARVLEMTMDRRNIA